MGSKSSIKILIALFVLFPALFPLAVSAALVDFTTSDFSGAADRQSFTYTHIDFPSITFTAMPTGSKLTWEAGDGIGIQSSWGGKKYEEINHPEILKVEFDQKVYLSKIYLTDLFIENGYSEKGIYSLDGGSSWTLFSAATDSGNGELTISLNSATLVQYLLFTAPFPRKHDYTLAKLDVSAVPIPAAAWLLGPGVLGLILIRRRVMR